jgi:hypothetical protein
MWVIVFEKCEGIMGQGSNGGKYVPINGQPLRVFYGQKRETIR